MNRVLVVGASGFIGNFLVRDLLSKGYAVSVAVRNVIDYKNDERVKVEHLPDLSVPIHDWGEILRGVNAIVYLAARVHVMNDVHPEPLSAYRAINSDAALSLAQAGVTHNVKRFIYISSIKVNGESSPHPFSEADTPHPLDDYGVSKLEAEHKLTQLGSHSDLEVVIIRPPLVYGPGVKANFMALAKAAGHGLPLPIGAIDNKRSMIYVQNLTDFIITALEDPKASGEVFLVSDGQDISTKELTYLLGEAQGKTPLLLPVPVNLLYFFGRLVGREDMIRRLTESLQVDITKAKTMLGWQPPFPVWYALARTGKSLNEHINLTVTDGGPKNYKLNTKQKVYLLCRSAIEKILASILLVILLPLLLMIYVLIRATSPGPALFTQYRAGKNHKPFLIYKFRTMHMDAPQLSTAELQKARINPVTRIGAILRRTSLDELPQLVNILKGQMSFVGPRPALMSQEVVLDLRRSKGVDILLPGITGYAQVKGRDDLNDYEKVEKDLTYLRNLSPKFDISIVLETIKSVVSGAGTK